MRQRKQVTKSEDLCDILFLWTLNEVCLVSRFLNPKSVSEARSQWKFSRADIINVGSGKYGRLESGPGGGQRCLVCKNFLDMLSWEEIYSNYITAAMQLNPAGCCCL